MVQSWVLDDVVEGKSRAGLRILGSVDQPVDPSKDEGACAHRARLEGHVKRASVQSPTSQLVRRCAEREYLSMCRRVPPKLTLVTRCCYDLAIAHHNGSDRNVVVIQRALGFLESKPHE